MTGPDQPDPYAPPGWDAPQPGSPQPGGSQPGWGTSQGWDAGWGQAPQPGAPVQPYAGYGPAETEGKAVVALVLAVSSYLFPLLPAIAALVVASAARRAIVTSGGRLGGDGLVKVAKVLAWVNIALSLLALLGLVGLVVLLAREGFSESGGTF